ncbi:MAG: hypothetical protein PHW54_05710 [Candidatus Omnitrophica bacterium]|nr:hypothetical protein [Candidatus Omnitrophota bacterium]
MNTMGKDKQENKVLYEDENQLDPLVTARREGKVWGAGLKGNFKRNKITVFGFLLLGLGLLSLSLLLMFQILTIYLPIKNAASFVNFYFYSLFSIGGAFLAGMIIFRVIKKRRE